jgi:hypothetical protein
MARPSGFLTDFDAAERLLDRRRTDGLVMLSLWLYGGVILVFMVFYMVVRTIAS